jgi:hypothetical protein
MVEEPNRYLRPFRRHKRILRGVSSQVTGHNAIKHNEKITADLQEVTRSPQNSTISLQFSTSSPSAEHGDVISLLDARIAYLSLQVTQTDDPAKLQELSQTITLLKRFRKNELSARRLQVRHWHDRRKRSRRRKFDDDSKQFDAVKLFDDLRILVDQHPTLARLTAERMGIDNLEEVMSMIGRILNDLKKKNAFTAYVGLGLTELVRDAITKFGK